MNTIKFSHDYFKLPGDWNGTQAVLIGVGDIDDMDKFKLRYPQLIIHDTTFRHEEGTYPLNFKQGLLLTFFHLNAKYLFTTIRRYTPEKGKYYHSKIMETFELKRVYE